MCFGKYEINVHKGFQGQKRSFAPCEVDGGGGGGGRRGGMMGRQFCPPSPVSSHLKKVLPVLGNCREVSVLLHSTSRSTVCFLGTS